MKLYQVCELYCDYDNNYLIASDKSSEEIKKEIHDKDKDGCLFYVRVKEINQIDGYNVVLEKAV